MKIVLQINAMVNRAAGKGYENEAFYENIKFQFMGIGNIHVMRKSLQKLVESTYYSILPETISPRNLLHYITVTRMLIYILYVTACEQNTPTMSSFLSGLESSGWLKHIK